MTPLRFAAVLALVSLTGCNRLIFPIWDPLYFDEPPAELGPHPWTEYRIELAEGANGEPTGLTIFEPVLDTPAPAPSMFWVLGSNVQAYYHQSLHETLASWGYVVVIDDGLELTYGSRKYHRRTVDLVKDAIDRGLANELTAVPLDPNRIAVGGYSIGGPMSVFTAAEVPEVDAAVLWAPSGAPFWQGLSPNGLYPLVTQEVLMVLGELDRAAPPDGKLPEKLTERLTEATLDTVVIEGGLHTQFQQPEAESAREPDTDLTRFEQQGIAIETTRAFLDDRFDLR